MTSSMHLSRWIVKQGKVGFGLRGAMLRSGFSGRCLSMSMALEEVPLVRTSAGPAGMARPTKSAPFWFPSTTSQPDVASLLREKSHVNSLASKIDGKAIADDIKKSLTQDVTWMKEKLGVVPGIAMVRVGDRSDSEVYVRGKQAACADVGINSYVTHLPHSASEADILEAIEKWNSDSRVHGILVQLPLPSHIQVENVLKGVNLEKDVDGLHPDNLGRLSGRRGDPTFLPCTPLGCMTLLARLGVDVEKKHVVVIGCSSVVGFPTAILLQKHKAEVTVVDINTLNPVEVTKKADIVISAAGVPQLVRGHWLKPGAIVIDVGITAVEDPDSESHYRVIGDVCFEEAERVASAITPVPGGVGPMTIAMLLSNTIKAARRSAGVEIR